MYWNHKSNNILIHAPIPGSNEDTDLWQEFRTYDNRNPNIYKEFIDIAFKARGKGHKKLSGMFIIQIMRWRNVINSNEKTYKICNNKFPYYVRKFILEYPDFEGFFRIKQLKLRR